MNWYAQKGEHDDDHFFRKDLVPFELHKDRLDRRGSAEHAVDLGYSQRDTDKGCG